MLVVFGTTCNSVFVFHCNCRSAVSYGRTAVAPIVVEVRRVDRDGLGTREESAGVSEVAWHGLVTWEESAGFSEVACRGVA